MQTYDEKTRSAEAQLVAARNALGRDLAAAISRKPWHKHLRSAFDAQALVEQIDVLMQDPAFMEGIQAASDRAREARGRGRGRPKKPAPAKPAKAPAPTEAAQQ